MGIPGYGHQTQQHQLVENFDAYFYEKKNHIYVSPLPGSIAKYCKLVILGTLDMADHTH